MTLRRFLYGSKKYIGSYSQSFTKSDCGNCYVGDSMTVTQDSVGGPFYSFKSQEDANDKAKRAVLELGQAYVNKNGSCTPLSADPVWKDVTPEELRCENGRSQKRQHDTNECSATYNQDRWVEGGDKICQWIGTYSKTFVRQCMYGGQGSSVVVNETMVSGNPFISIISQEDANNKAKEAVEAQGQEWVNAHGRCTWIGKYSGQFTRNNCGTCQHGSTVTITQDHVGGPFTSFISQADANKMAQDAVNSKGQSVANSIGSCIADSTTPSWSDTGSTRCSGCTSQKQQRDTNSCSNSYNSTRWVSGGGRTCADWNYYGTGDCVGHTRYNAYRDDCSGEIDNRYSVDCNNCCNCGSYGSWSSSGCSGNQVKYVRYDDCGNADYRYEYEDGKCGYVACRLSLDSGSQSAGYVATSVSVSGSTSSGSTVSSSSNQSWCTPSVSKKVGSDSFDIIIEIDTNTSTSSRSATVTVRNSCGESSTISVSQSGRPNKTVNKAVADSDCAKRCGLMRISKNTGNMYSGSGATDDEAYADWQSKWECNGECKGQIIERTGDIVATYSPSGTTSSRWINPVITVNGPSGRQTFRGQISSSGTTLVFSGLKEGSYSVSMTGGSADCGTGTTIANRVEITSYTRNVTVKAGFGNEAVISISARITCN